MKQLLTAITVLIVIATIIAFTPAIAQGAATTVEKVPMITVEDVQMGNSPFGSVEQFQIHFGKSVVKRTGSSLDLSFANNLVSPINDTLSFNDSIHLSKNQITENFTGKNGTFKLVTPPQQSYLNSMTISGNSSYSWLTIVEMVPASSITMNGLYANGTHRINSSGIYNLTIDYSGYPFVLHSPGLVYVGGYLTNVSLLVNNSINEGRAFISFSFPITDGSFSVVFNQVLTSSQQINNDVMSYYQINSGFQSPLLQNLVSNSISIAVGGAIFLIIIIGLFAYYKKK
ncbi:MAG: hypothetical protein ACP5UZ_05310 [Thermoplasmata archaeon]